MGVNVRALSVAGKESIARRFSEHRRLTVRQKKRWLEILLSFETKNAYDVYDEDQRAVLKVREVGGGLGEFLKRMFLGPLRPFHAEISDASSGEVVMSLHRPFRFIFHRLEVSLN